jgi:transglutaminase-like putative cysteine protease
MLKKVALLIAFFAITPVAGAQEIQNSEAVSYLHAEVTRSGYVYLFDNSPFQTARELTVTLTVPQNSTRQASYIKSVTGPDRYYMGEDSWGNKVVNLYWEIPGLKKRLHYTVVYDVEVSDGLTKEGGTTAFNQGSVGNAKFPVTDFTKATTGIAQVTFDVTYGLDDMQRFFRLTEWIHKNVKYDNEAKGFSQSAIWTFLNRKGACDEFSNLLISMLRVLGYEPRYVVGYAYSENWGQHG